MRPLSSLESCLPLPVPELCRGFVEVARPRNQIFHASCCKQRTVGLKTMNTDVLGVRYNSFAPEISRLLRFCLQADRAYARDCRQRTAALFDTLCLVQIANAFFRNDVTHVVPVNHDWRDGHSCLLANLDRVQCFNEGRNPATGKGFKRLNNEFPPPSG